MTHVLSIDPGTSESAWLRFDGERPLDFGILPNDELRNKLFNGRPAPLGNIDHVAIEGVASYGKPVGAEVFTTCIWIGRFIEAWGGDYTLVYRPQVKVHLCHATNAKDPMVRQALIDKFGGDSRAVGGTRCQECGGRGTKGRQQVECDECKSTGRVAAKRAGQTKTCPRCSGRGVRQGEPATCVDCRGSKWRQPPGPLHGLTSHCWSALAVACYWWETHQKALESA